MRMLDIKVDLVLPLINCYYYINAVINKFWGKKFLCEILKRNSRYISLHGVTHEIGLCCNSKTSIERR